MIPINQRLGDLKEIYRNRMNITRADGLTKVLIRQPKDGQQFERNSDLIFIFSLQRDKVEHVAITERVPKERYSGLQWSFLVAKYTLMPANLHLKDCVRDIVIASEYIDITLYKEWWFEFLKGYK